MSFDVSVLMSVYRGEKPERLFAALESVFDQTLRPKEVVLVKDGPLTRELEEVIGNWREKEPERFRVVELTTNKGLARALNFGLRRCACELVARMDSDDISARNRIEREVAYMKDSGADVVGSYIEERDETMERVLCVRKVPLSHEAIERYSLWRNPVNHVSALYKKSAVLAVGGYSTRLQKIQDYVLWVKLMKAGYKFVNVPEPLVMVRAGEEFLLRRGGIGYFKYDVAMLLYLWRIGAIGFRIMAANMIVRFLARMSPVAVRRRIYRKLREC